MSAFAADIGTKLGIPAYIVYYNIEGADYPTFKIAKINVSFNRNYFF